MVFKHEILNRKQLDYVKTIRCKILIIHQTVVDNSHNLIIENERGEVEKVTPFKLEQILKPKEGNEINIDTVFINMINGNNTNGA